MSGLTQVSCLGIWGCLSLGWRTQGSKEDVLSLCGDLERDVPEHLGLYLSQERGPGCRRRSSGVLTFLM